MLLTSRSHGSTLSSVSSNTERTLIMGIVGLFEWLGLMSRTALVISRDTIKLTCFNRDTLGANKKPELRIQSTQFWACIKPIQFSYYFIETRLATRPCLFLRMSTGAQESSWQRPTSVGKIFSVPHNNTFESCPKRNKFSFCYLMGLKSPWSCPIKKRHLLGIQNWNSTYVNTFLRLNYTFQSVDQQSL